MDDFEKEIEEYRRKKEEKRMKFFNTCREKINDGTLIYRSLALFIAKRFKLHIDDYFDVDNSVYEILNYYIENVDEDFEKWLNKDDAPLIRKRSELRKVFPEFKFIDSDKKLVDNVNNLYGLDLHLSDDCFWSVSFDFNSFIPIDVEEIHRIKEEIKVLEKYGYPVDDLKEKLDSFNLDEDILEGI